MRRCLGIMVIMAMGGALAACSVVPWASSPPTAEAPAVKPPPPRPPDTARRIAPPLPPPPEAATPGDLTGLSREQTIALLGHPASETPQAMGTVWRYRKGSCHLALVLYPEVETNVERVLSYEFTQGSDPAACLKRLRRSGGPNGK